MRKKHAPGCPCCTDCRHTLCVLLRDACGGSVTDVDPSNDPPFFVSNIWHLKIYAPSGELAYDSHDDPGWAQISFYYFGCVNTLEWGAGTYTAVAEVTRNLSAVNGPSAHYMMFSRTIEVTDPCAAPAENVELDICEDWYAFRFLLPCGGGEPDLPCSPGSEAEVTGASPGTATQATAHGNDWVCFTDYDCLVEHTLGFTITPVSSWLSGSYTRSGIALCDPSTTVAGFRHGFVTFDARAEFEGSSGHIGPVTGGPAENGFVCACCETPMRETMDYADSDGVACVLTYDGDPESDTFGLWVGQGGSTSDAAGRLSDDPYDAYDRDCCEVVPGGAYLATITAECLTAESSLPPGEEPPPPGCIRWRVRKYVWACGDALTPPCPPPPFGVGFCPLPGTDAFNPFNQGVGYTEVETCDPGTAHFASGAMVDANVGASCTTIEAIPLFSLSY